MTAVADSGGGSGHVAQSPDDAAGIFAEEFEDVAARVAQNPRLLVPWLEGLSRERRMIGS